MKRTSVVNKGDVFHFNIKGGWAGGMVTFVGKGRVIMGIFPLKRFNAPPDGAEVLKALSENLVYETRLGTLGFEKDGWQIVEHHTVPPEPFDVIPGFYVRSANAVAVVGEDLVHESQHIPLGIYHARIGRWGMAGHVYVARLLALMIDAGGFPAHIRAELPPGYTDPRANA